MPRMKKIIAKFIVVLTQPIKKIKIPSKKIGLPNQISIAFHISAAMPPVLVKFVDRNEIGRFFASLEC